MFIPAHVIWAFHTVELVTISCDYGNDNTSSPDDHRFTSQLLQVYARRRYRDRHSAWWRFLPVTGTILGCATPSGYKFNSIRYHCTRLLSAFQGHRHDFSGVVQVNDTIDLRRGTFTGEWVSEQGMRRLLERGVNLMDSQLPERSVLLSSSVSTA